MRVREKGDRLCIIEIGSGAAWQNDDEFIACRVSLDIKE